MSTPLIDIHNVSKEFQLKGKLLHAVQNVSLSLAPGEILGLGGESGCGKSTIGKMVMGLIEPTSGSIFIEGQNLNNLTRQRSQAWRRHVQMIFQHPAASLNPRMSIKEILEEPFVIHGLAKRGEMSKHMAELLFQVGLSEDFLNRMPHELSGGQKQRIAIARALALEPRLLICDEPFSALDVSVQAQIINLLANLQREHQLSYLVISHDLSILRYLAHRLAIMYLGQMMEMGASNDVYHHPLHPYSQALVSAILLPDPSQERKKSHIFVKGEVPSLMHPSIGCPFYARCPFAKKICETVKPAWKEVKPNHFAACHLY
jgi:peptide/nickel transport system ATP-binding protein/oligopeptide transport system ATP-binding protein